MLLLDLSLLLNPNPTWFFKGEVILFNVETAFPIIFPSFPLIIFTLATSLIVSYAAPLLTELPEV